MTASNLSEAKDEILGDDEKSIVRSAKLDNAKSAEQRSFPSAP
jgi:hypothetical protein